MSQGKMWTHSLHNHISTWLFSHFQLVETTMCLSQSILDSLKMFSESARQTPKL